MKIFTLSLFFALLPTYLIQAQVGIGTTTPNASLDIKSSNEATPANTDGLLVPKVDEFPVTAPTAAQDGMMVFATGAGSVTKGFYYWDNSAANWLAVVGVKKINDLIDGKSDNDGTQNGSSVFLGVDAGAVDNSTDNRNVGIGFEALKSNTTGYNNTANGYQSLTSNTTGLHNTASGQKSLYSNTTGLTNTANGYQSLYSNTTGSINTANGYQSLYSNVTGSSNTASGQKSLYSNTTGDRNTANGNRSLYSNTTGDRNTANGYSSLYSNTTGNNNTANGNSSLYSNTTGYRNTANGVFSLVSNTTGFNNTSNGYSSLSSNTTGNNNTANGNSSLYSNTVGYSNTANGYQSLCSNTTGYRNTANGYQSLYSNTSGYGNTANGYLSLYSNTTGNYNTANGNQSLYSNTTGFNNTANGYQSLYNNTTGYRNTANGNSSLYSNTTGYNNTANGYQSLFSNTTGYRNTANGNRSLYSNITGVKNVALGNNAGYFETGSNKLYIENTDADADNALLYGNFGTDNTTTGNVLRINGELQLGTTAANRYFMPTARGTANQIMQTDGSGQLNFIDPATIGDGVGAEKINDLTDGKSDNDGTQNGSSVFLGVDAGLNDDQSDNQNVGIGFEALKTNTTGIGNTANGFQSLFSNITGIRNTANGTQNLYSNITGSDNTANGLRALYLNTIGSFNTANGYQALHNNITGSGNVALGYEAGMLETGSNKLYIENTDANANNALIYGDFGTDITTTGNILRINGELQLGTTSANRYFLPTARGTTNQILQTDGSGQLSFVNPTIISNTLDQAYDKGGAGAGRIITADSGAVIIGGEDGFVVKGLNGVGNSISEIGTGSRMFFNPRKGAFRAGDVRGDFGLFFNNVWNDTNVGQFSFAGGINTLASAEASTAFGSLSKAIGNNSFATGFNTTASGFISTAMGRVTTALGNSSTAMGNETTASGDFSTAMGNNTIASRSNETAMGMFNAIGSLGRLFSIGNGIDITNKSNAFEVFDDGSVKINDEYTLPTTDGAANYIMQTDGGGNVTFVDPSTVGTDNQNLELPTLSGTTLTLNIEDGTGTSIDLAPILDGNTQNTLDQAYDEGGAGAGKTINATDGVVTIAGEDGFLVTGTVGFGEDISISGAGVRMFFNPKKAAFRAGGVSNSEWDLANVGVGSVAFGLETTASGINSTAMGNLTTASGDFSTAMGSVTIASGINSTAMGIGTIASGSNSTSMGNGTRASGQTSIAMGLGTEASGITSIAMGHNTLASSDNSIAMGFGTTASGDNSTAMGRDTTSSGENTLAMGFNTIASGNHSTAMGFGTTASFIYETAIGNLNGLGSFGRLFSIGNGSIGLKSNAFEVFDDGRVEINDEYTLPTTDGAANYIMQTDGGGNVTFVDPATIGDGTGTDNQNLELPTLSGTTLTLNIEDGTGTSINLAPILDGTGTDNQNLLLPTLSGTTLTLNIEDGASTSINLASILDGTGTDDQNLLLPTLSGTTLTLNIEDGASTSINLASILDGTGTDNQNLLLPTLSGTTLTLNIEDGASTSINLASILDGNTQNTLDQSYDEGGAGVGRIINTTNGAVLLDGTDGLEVNGAAAGILIANTSENESGIHFKDDGNSTEYADINYDSGASNLLNFYVDSATALMSLDDSQRVGIGTTSPDTKLAVVGIISAAFETTETNKVELAHGGANAYINVIGAGRLDFRHEGAIGMTFTDTNRLGVGTTSPDEKLSVSGIANLNEDLTAAGVALKVSGDEAIWYNDTRFSWGSGGTSNTFADDVGIGMTSVPSYRLDVRDSPAGDYVAQIYNTNTDANADGLKIRLGRTSPITSNNFIGFFDGSDSPRGEITGNASGVQYNTTSDRRLKTNIVNITNALELLNKIQPRKYEFKTNLGIKEYGFIAQELQIIYPQAVAGSPDSNVETDPMMVDYSRLTPLLTAGIKELKEEVDVLKEENKKLKIKLSNYESLEARLIALENVNSTIEDLQNSITEKK